VKIEKFFPSVTFIEETMFPDVQTRLPEIKISLGRVGVTKVRKLLEIPRKGKRPIILLANFNCFVDLPSSQKGTHMSRNLEAINELLEDIVKKPVYELEGLCEDIVVEILERHDYAGMCEVEMKSNLMIMGKTPSQRTEQEFVKLLARAKAFRGDPIIVDTEVGAEIRGVILHPHKHGGIPGCSQRATASLIIQTPKAWVVKIEDIVEVLEASTSSKAYSHLTEKEEKKVLNQARASPKFVDQVVLEILHKAVENFNLPDDMKISAKCVAEETLYTYNSFAQRSTTFGKLRFK
jgi:GTP cyclohydrolase-4